MKKNKTPFKTLDKFNDDPRVRSIEYEGDDGIWLYIADGYYDAESDCHSIHEKTVKGILAAVKWIEPDPRSELQKKAENFNLDKMNPDELAGAKAALEYVKAWTDDNKENPFPFKFRIEDIKAERLNKKKAELKEKQSLQADALARQKQIDGDTLRNLQICRVIMANTPGEHLIREALNSLSQTIGTQDYTKIDEINASPELAQIKKILNLDPNNYLDEEISPPPGELVISPDNIKRLLDSGLINIHVAGARVTSKDISKIEAKSNGTLILTIASYPKNVNVEIEFSRDERLDASEIPEDETKRTPNDINIKTDPAADLKTGDWVYCYEDPLTREDFAGVCQLLGPQASTFEGEIYEANGKKYRKELWTVKFKGERIPCSRVFAIQIPEESDKEALEEAALRG